MTQNLLQSIRGALTQNLPVPTGIDGGRLAIWAEAGHFSYESVRSICGAAIQALNEETAAAWGDLISLTTDQAVMYMNGGAVTPAEITMGRSRPTLVKGFNAGHMIDLKVWALGVGGTSREFEDMTESQLTGSIVSLATALRDTFDQQLLTRMFTNSENLLGTAGYDLGWCDGSPGGTVLYAPPKYNGKTFYEDHQHYVGYDSGAGKTFYDVASGLALLVAEHGLPINQDFKMYVSETDAETWRALTQFVQPVDNINDIDRGGSTTGPQYFEGGSVGYIPASGGRYIGGLNTGYGIGRIFASPRIPTGYASLYRPGAAFAANNGLRVRYRASTGWGARITEIPDFTTTFPIKEVHVESEFGISCGPNRYAAAVGELVSGGTFTNPTIL